MKKTEKIKRQRAARDIKRGDSVNRRKGIMDGAGRRRRRGAVGEQEQTEGHNTCFTAVCLITCSHRGITVNSCGSCHGPGHGGEELYLFNKDHCVKHPQTLTRGFLFRFYCLADFHRVMQQGQRSNAFNCGADPFNTVKQHLHQRWPSARL